MIDFEYVSKSFSIYETCSIGIQDNNANNKPISVLSILDGNDNNGGDGIDIN